MRSQRAKPRLPQQERARQKIELILEAAIRLLSKDRAALTTNAVAETAGVSIGTLYQYFADKDAILDALADRETARLSQRIRSAIQGPTGLPLAEQIALIIEAVTSSYGGRRHVYRLVMEHSLARGGGRIAPLIEQLVTLLTAEDGTATTESGLSTRHADAFVLTNAFAGVMRAMILWQDAASPPREQIQASLVRLITGFRSPPPPEPRGNPSAPRGPSRAAARN
ncbi:TetR/AcrR family transcriptional regulator [Sphingomonas sp. BIUV-7]|uniref:TetR/AcrR family transcriptional regulator n=1 Tax=Sphingomonas natans TaxID=3063330 RepID=A0ABT8YBE8_9SPHN|nr:TetR/AcrR family transcriptional regulator [Sphingomonas sp. BIUV-7]MDO6415034.1 TetR/AcrR family transcriptional regulator [Sphingomonas sp. BIUV-7]